MNAQGEVQPLYHTPLLLPPPQVKLSSLQLKGVEDARGFPGISSSLQNLPEKPVHHFPVILIEWFFTFGPLWRGTSQT